jgi:hypothetical protein
VVERRAGLHWLHAMPSLLPGTPLARAGAHAEVDRAVGLALAERARALAAVGGEWVIHRPEGPPIEPEAIAQPAGETRVLTTAIVGLEGGIEEVWRRLDRRSRQDLAAGARLAVAEAPGRIEEAFALHAARWRAWGAAHAIPLELSRRLLADEPDDPLARLFTISDGRGVLAAVLVLTGRHEWFAWWSGARDEARRRHGFGALLWAVAARAADAGATRFNVGASAGRESVEGFKRSLGARLVRTPVRWLDASESGALGRSVSALQERWRRSRSRGEPA